MTVPRALVIQIDLFAGQLYIGSREDYQEICKFLGLSIWVTTEGMTDQGWNVAADGLILSDDEGRVGGQSGLTKTPVNFFKILMSTIRRNGDGIVKTHLGSLLTGKLFHDAEFEIEQCSMIRAISAPVTQGSIIRISRHPVFFVAEKILLSLTHMNNSLAFW